METVYASIAQHPGLYYLDNLESLFGAAEKSNQEVVAFLGRIGQINHTEWLASSRQDLPDWKHFRLSRLTKPAAVQLFLEEWNQSSGQNILLADQPLEDFVEYQLAGHPLSIVLTASHGRDYGDIAAVIRAWNDLNVDITTKYAAEQSQRKQDSLDTSIILSVRQLSNSPNALLLWSLFVFYPEGMDRTDQQDWIAQGAFSQKDILELVQRNLLQNQGGVLSMLPPLVRFAKIHLNNHTLGFSESHLFEQSASFSWSVLPKDYFSVSEKLLKRLPFIFAFLDYFSTQLSSYPDLTEVALKMKNFYSYQIWDGKKILTQLIQQSHLKSQEKNWAEWESNLGELEFRLGNNEAARTHFDHAYSLYEKTGSDQGKANGEWNLGSLEFRLGNNEAARTHFAHAYTLYEKTGSDLGKANCESNLGELEFHLGNNEAARTHFAHAYTLYEKTGSDLGKAACEWNLGELEFRLGNNEAARTHFANAYTLYEKTGSDQGKANCEINLGELEFHLGNNEAARTHFDHAYTWYEKTGDDQGKAACERNLGELEFHLGNNEAARTHFDHAYTLYEKTGSDQGKANCERNLGELEFHLGNKEAARTHFAQSLHLAEKCGYILGEALAYLALAKLAQAEEDQAAACSKLRQAAVIGQQIQDAALMEEVKTLQAAWSCDN